MSLLPKESIKVVAEAAGIIGMHDEIATALASDVEYRIREITQEAIKFMKRSKRDTLTTDDVNSALRLRNIEVLYGFSASDPLKFRRVTGTSDLFYIADNEIDISEITNAPLPRCPRDISLHTHWLAIEGVQPAVPQNPTASDIAPPPTPKKRKVIPSEPNSDAITTEVKPIVKHVLSKEMQLYFEKITSAIKGKDSVVFDSALNSLRLDPSLHQLLPYFTQFISDEVTKNLSNLHLLKNITQMIKAILDSKYLHIEPYLHQLMPAILTCIVGKKLAEGPMDNHWELRDFSATLVSQICKRFGDAYTSLLPRITKTLTHALQDVTKPLTTHYGAIVGITALGPRSVETLLLPNLKAYMSILIPETKSSNAVKKHEASQCYEAMLAAVGSFLKYASAEELKTGANPDSNIQKKYHELFDIFGERLIPFLKQVQPTQAIL
jgi:transcription initiation factor TFIID subunit 6